MVWLFIPIWHNRIAETHTTSIHLQVLSRALKEGAARSGLLSSRITSKKLAKIISQISFVTRRLATYPKDILERRDRSATNGFAHPVFLVNEVFEFFCENLQHNVDPMNMEKKVDLLKINVE